MKKFVTLGFVAVFGMALATGCQKKEQATSETPTTSEQPAVVEETGTAATATTSTGTATTSTESSMTSTTGTGTATTTETKPTTSTETKKKM